MKKCHIVKMSKNEGAFPTQTPMVAIFPFDPEPGKPFLAETSYTQTKLLRTSKVESITKNDLGLLVKTKNSEYQLFDMEDFQNA